MKKSSLYITATLLAAIFNSPSNADNQCDNLAVPYKNITTKVACHKAYSSCWYDGKCYDVDRSGCNCLKTGGKFCSMNIGGGNQTEYCLWGDKACDSWRLFRKQCKKPGVKLTEYPPNQDDYCRLEGGEVDADKCVGWSNNAGVQQSPCLLEDLWNLKCPSKHKKHKNFSRHK
jgi:hypothetical protein